MNRTNMDRCLTAASALLVGGMLLAAAAPVQAQGAQLDPRWQAWIGCWEPVGAQRTTPGGGAAHEVCVMPVEGTSAVDIATVDGPKILSREHIEATGQHHPISEDGCTGWQSAEWSTAARRVYLHSESTCAGGLKRTSNGVLAISPEGDLLDIRRVAAGTGAGVHLLRYREAPPSKTLPSVAAALQDRTVSVAAARTAAEAPVTPSDVIEASKHLDAGVLQAWLVARDVGFNLDGKQLTKLADAGVPGPVIDAIVALSYPRVFAINPSTGSGEVRPPEQRRVAEGYGDDARPTTVVYLDPYYGYSPFGWDYFSPFGYSAFGYSAFGYSGFGYPGFGYGWYPGYNPVVIVKNPDNTRGTHGKLVKGRGYTTGTGGNNSGRSARPSSSSRSSSRVAHPRSAPPPRIDSGASAARSGSSSSSGATATRTAHKRPDSR